MPIEIKYGSPGAVGWAGFAAGMGQGMQKQLQAYMPLVMQQIRINAEREDRERAYAEQVGRERRASAEQFGRDQWMDRNRLDQDVLDHEQSLTQQDRMFGQQRLLAQERGEQGYDREILEGIRRGQVELSPLAQKRLSEIENEIGRLEESDRFTSDERGTQRTQLERERRRLWRSATPTVKEALTPSEQWKSQTALIDPMTGQPIEPGSGQKGIPVGIDPKTGRPVGIQGLPYDKIWEGIYGPSPEQQQKKAEAERKQQ